MTEEELENTREEIEIAWEKYSILQKLHESETGKEWEWLK